MKKAGTIWSRRIALTEVVVVIGVLIVTTEISLLKDLFNDPLMRNFIQVFSSFLLYGSIFSLSDEDRPNPKFSFVVLLIGFFVGVLSTYRFGPSWMFSNAVLEGVGGALGGALGWYLGSKVGYWTRQNPKTKEGGVGMSERPKRRWFLGLLLPLAAIVLQPSSFVLSDVPMPQIAQRYNYRTDHDPDGTGKFYMGREIAQVMGHEGADWLDRPEREREEQPTKLLDALKLKPGDVVADIGAGSGYLTFRMAPRVGPKGKVFAEDIQPEMLDIIRQRMKSRGVSNVRPVLGTITDPKLPPNSTDLILLVDVYHEFSHPWEMTQAMVKGLKPGGRIAFVEYRLEDPDVPIKLVHKMSEKQIRKEMAVQPLRWVETLEVLPRQHIFIFQKPKKNEPKRR
jgi:ubiquinone/menaquinone biosynthesis C-methylase UbiE